MPAIGTKFPLTIECRIIEIEHLPDSTPFFAEEGGQVRIKWKCADASDPGAFEEPPVGEPKRYGIGEVTLDAATAIDSSGQFQPGVLDVLAEATTRDVVHHFLTGLANQ